MTESQELAEQRAREFAAELGVNYADLTPGAEAVDPEVATRLPESLCRGLRVLPLQWSERAVVLATDDPGGLKQELRGHLPEGAAVTYVVAEANLLNRAITRAWRERLREFAASGLQLGELLVRSGMLDRRQLAEAVSLHEEMGDRLGRILVDYGFLRSHDLVKALAAQQGWPQVQLLQAEIRESGHALHVPGAEAPTMGPAVSIQATAVRILPESFCREHFCVPLSQLRGELLLAMADPADREIIAQAEAATGLRVQAVVTGYRDVESVLERVYHSTYTESSVADLMRERPIDSAHHTVSERQVLAAVIVIVITFLLIRWNYVVFFILLNLLFTVFYFGVSLYKTYLILRSLRHSIELHVTADEYAAYPTRDLPMYTILIPAYREASVLPNLIQAIEDLDYPKSRLDVKLLLESEDTETIAAARRYAPPTYFKFLLLPPSAPQTKPKACNYGLLHAEGKYCVIFDAEDIPDRDQLKKAVIAFTKAPAAVACVQAKLSYYNRHQNLLTKWFTSEYAMWFDLLLPGLDAAGSPIPLGGTSNHFVTEKLIEVGAWDPYNVAEDADLGIRLYKDEWRTAIFNSTTMEEANSEFVNWVRQRSRWIKGYIQTYLVHMRQPIRLYRTLGPAGFLGFQMVVGGTFLACLLNPFYWFLGLMWLLAQWSLIPMIFPNFVYHIGLFNLFIGNFLFTYVNVTGSLRRRHYELVRWALLSPFYWAMMSVAAWKAALQLVFRPSFWEKTIHGLYRGSRIAQPGA